MAFDVTAARSAGYSDAEIANYLGEQNKMDVAGARKAGYSDAEIINHFSGSDVKPTPAKEPAKAAPTKYEVPYDAMTKANASNPAPQDLAGEAARQVGLTVRAGGQAAADLVGLVANPIANAVNWAAGKKVMTPISDLANQKMTEWGLPQPKNDLEQAVQAGSSAIANTGMMAAAAKIAPTVASLFTNKLGTQAAVGAGSAMGSEVAAKAADQEGYGPVAKTASALAGGMIGGGLGAMGATMAGKANIGNTKIGQLLGALPADKPITAEDVKAAAGQVYKDAQESGVYVRSKSMVEGLDNMQHMMEGAQGFQPDLSTHRDIAVTLNNIRKDLSRHGVVSFSNLEQYRQNLTALSRESSEESTRTMARKAVNAFDDMVAGLTGKDLAGGTTTDLKDVAQGLKDARNAWRKASNAETIQDVLERALTKAETGGGGLDKGLAIQRELRTLLLDKNQMARFSSDEQATIRRIATNGFGEGTLQAMGKLDPRKLSGATVAGAMSASGGAALPLMAGGVAANQITAAMKQTAMKQLQQDILSGKTTRPTNEKAMRVLLESYINTQYRNADKPQE